MSSSSLLIRVARMAPAYKTPAAQSAEQRIALAQLLCDLAGVHGGPGEVFALGNERMGSIVGALAYEPRTQNGDRSVPTDTSRWAGSRSAGTASSRCTSTCRRRKAKRRPLPACASFAARAPMTPAGVVRPGASSTLSVSRNEEAPDCMCSSGAFFASAVC